MPLIFPREKHHPYFQRWRIWRWIQTELCFPQFLVFAHTLCPIIFLHSFPLFIKPNKNTQIQPFLPVFISLWRCLCHIKLILNKLLCFSLVNLSFINLIYRVPAREPGKGKRKNIFPFPTHTKQNDLDSFVHGRQFKCVPYENLWIEIVMSSKLSNMSLPEIIMLYCHFYSVFI